LRFARNFLILLLVAAGIILVSVLLIAHVNEALGYIVIPLLVVFFVAPLAQRLRRLGKLLTKGQLINAAATATTLAIMWGTGWGLSHASLMLKQGVHPKIVQERLGHSSIQVTLDTYSHVAPGLQEAAANEFDNFVLSKSQIVTV